MKEHHQPINALPTRESTSQHQIFTLLEVTAALRPYLLPSHDADSPHKLPPQLDGGAVAAAATTFIKTCACIDDLVDDKSRWGLDQHDALLKMVSGVMEQQKLFLMEQMLAAQSLRRPCFRFQPTLIQADNEFLAIFGDPFTPGAHIIGRGLTPNAALDDFDAAFSRVPAEQLSMLAEEPEVKHPKKRKK